MPLRGKGVERGGKGRDGNKGRGGRERGALRGKGVERGGEEERGGGNGRGRIGKGSANLLLNPNQPTRQYNTE